jgi:hypothetical protein
LKKPSGRVPKDGFQPFQQSHPEDFPGNRGVILEVVVEKSDRRSVFQHSQLVAILMASPPTLNDRHVNAMKLMRVREEFRKILGKQAGSSIPASSASGEEKALVPSRYSQ